MLSARSTRASQYHHVTISACGKWNIILVHILTWTSSYLMVCILPVLLYPPTLIPWYVPKMNAPSVAWLMAPTCKSEVVYVLHTPHHWSLLQPVDIPHLATAEMYNLRRRNTPFCIATYLLRSASSFSHWTFSPGNKRTTQVCHRHPYAELAISVHFLTQALWFGWNAPRMHVTTHGSRRVKYPSCSSNMWHAIQGF